MARVLFFSSSLSSLVHLFPPSTQKVVCLFARPSQSCFLVTDAFFPLSTSCVIHCVHPQQIQFDCFCCCCSLVEAPFDCGCPFSSFPKCLPNFSISPTFLFSECVCECVYTTNCVLITFSLMNSNNIIFFVCRFNLAPLFSKISWHIIIERMCVCDEMRMHPTQSRFYPFLNHN